MCHCPRALLWRKCYLNRCKITYFCTIKQFRELAKPFKQKRKSKNEINLYFPRIYFAKNIATKNMHSVLTPITDAILPVCLFIYIYSPVSNWTEVKVRLRLMVSRPVCLGVGLPSGTNDQNFLFCLTIADFLILDTVSDESTIASGPCQSSHSRVQILQNSRPDFTVSFETRRLSWRYSNPPPHGPLTELSITTDTQSASPSWCQTPIQFFPFSLWLFFRQIRVCWCGAPSLARSRVHTFEFLPGIARAAFLRSESHGTHEYILLSLFLRLPQPVGPGSCVQLALRM
jgi:hypothetical protein